jgi:hypothetical protein
MVDFIKGNYSPHWQSTRSVRYAHVLALPVTFVRTAHATGAMD